jgi:DNA polymerase/3'-5' exonuclease PolX
MSIYNQFLQISGIGIVKANQLINMGIKSIDELILEVEKNPQILSPAQKIGLRYYQDISLKIPRRETQRHLRKISKEIKDLKSNLMIKVVGSYRRGEMESSDIDIILTTKKNKKINSLSHILDKVIDKLKKIEYLIADISHGTKKYMGIAKISKRSPARRIDLLL